MIAVDFETFYSSKHSVRDLGPWAYAHHPETDIYLVSIVPDEDDKDVEAFVGDPRDYDTEQLHEKHLISHNAAFDSIVARAAIERGLIKPFTPASWSCTADLVTTMGLPRSLGDAYKTTTGQDVDKGMRDFMRGKKWSDAVAAGKADALMEYARLDGVYCLDLWKEHSPKWTNIERALSAHTRVLIHRGVHVDRDALDKAITKIRAIKDGIHFSWEDEGRAKTSPIAIRKKCEAEGIPCPSSFAKDNKECLEWENKYGDSNPWIRQLRTVRSCSHLLPKLKSIKKRIREDGTMPVYLKHNGARTGRWSGAAGVNMQNLPRGEMFGVNLRHLFIPAPGKKFVICDLSQIEPRVLHWLAGDTEFLERVKNGEPVYQAHAAQTMGYTGNDLKTEIPKDYQLAKARVLGLGYGCGADKFRIVAEAMTGLKLTKSDAEETVSKYRIRNPKITGYWKTIYQELVNRKYPMWETQPPNTPITDLKLKSGRKLFYTWDDVQMTYGGKLTENVCQATARDIFAEQLLKIEAAGYPIVFHVHDEVIAEVDADKAEEALAHITEIMSTPPEWAKNLTLSAEGGCFDYYDK